MTGEGSTPRKSLILQQGPVWGSLVKVWEISCSKGRRVLDPELQWQSTSVLKEMTSLLPNHEEA